jgi:hypothetical protein
MKPPKIAEYLSRVTVYAASSRNVDKKYLDMAEYLGIRLAESGKEIIYGGGKIGLMGALADGSVSAGGKVIGVIPKFMNKLDLGNTAIAELHEVEGMHQRQYIMLKGSSCIITLPGGCGTMLELLEAISWKKLGLLTSRLIIINFEGYFDPLIKMLENAINTGFMSNEHKQIWCIATSVDEVMKLVMEKKVNIERTIDILPV